VQLSAHVDGAPAIVPVVFDGDGLELYGRANLGRFSVLGGFVDYAPDATSDRVDPDFRVRYFILGGEMQLKRNASAYAEWRIDDSKGAQGTEGTSVFTIGLRYGFATKGLHGLY
jgi:predicted porin